MTPKQFEQAARIMDQIKFVDSQIIEVDRMALQMANEDLNVVFSISTEKENAVAKDGNIDKDGYELTPRSYLSQMMSYGMFLSPSGFGKPDEPKKDVHTIKKEVDNKIGLLMLGVLLGELHKERDGLISQLRKKGVDI